MVDLWSQPTNCIPQKCNPLAIKKRDMGKLKTGFVIRHESNSNQNNGESKISKTWNGIERLWSNWKMWKLRSFCPQGWGLHGMTPIWYHKSPKLNPLVTKRNRPKLNPLVSKQNHPKFNPLVSKQNPCCVLYGYRPAWLVVFQKQAWNFEKWAKAFIP